MSCFAYHHHRIINIRIIHVIMVYNRIAPAASATIGVESTTLLLLLLIAIIAIIAVVQQQQQR